LLLDTLKNKVKENYIICLQELSDEWISVLFPFFVDNKYTFAYDSQFCGVGIAFPSHFKLQEIECHQVGDKLKKLVDDECKNNIDSWQRSVSTRNRILLLTLRHGSTTFSIANYHMPCKFRDSSLMMIHASMILQIAKEFANGKPYILAGDFNSTPDSNVYKMITGVEYQKDYEQVSYMTPAFNTGDLTSVYTLCNNKEPCFTNYSNAGDNGDFCDTIDYIFLSNHWKVKNVLDLIDKPETYLPNERQPSDHLPIGATIEVQFNLFDEFVSKHLYSFVNKTNVV
jgi:endonuclease/exonuclease/phosphatase family metal-dependent hydrolase